MKRLLATLILGALLLAGCGPTSTTTLAPEVAEAAPPGAPPVTPVGPPDQIKPEPPHLPPDAEQPAAPGQQEPAPAEPTPVAAPPAASPAPRAPRVAVLMYHDVNDQQQDAYTISAALLEAQIQMMLDEGYHFYTLTDIERLLAGEEMPEKGVMLTFDDGYASFYGQVVPMAERLRVPVINFVVTMYLDQTVIGGRPHMTSAETRAAAASPFGELGGHSYNGHYVAKVATGSFQPALTHQILRPGVFEYETAEQYAERVLDDYQRASRLLASHGETTGLRHFAFPFTSRSDEAVRLGQEAGFSFFYVGGEQLAHAGTDPTNIPRVHAGAPYISAEWLRDRLRWLFAQD